MRANRLFPGLVAVCWLVGSCFQDTGGGEEDTGAEMLCSDYCSAVMESCTGTNQQYTTEVACQKLCEFMEPGAEGEVGNSIHCRLSRALEVAEAPGDMKGAVCRQAGPGGDGVCGGNCESLCSLTREICTGESQQWVNDTECIAECNMLGTDEPYSTNVESGPSVACRLYHLNLATSNALTHCPHVGGASPCENP